jgi:hypothetical protein
LRNKNETLQFGGIIDGSFYKTEGDGYVAIPSALFPLTSHSKIKDVLPSLNPLYKAYLYLLYHNTHKKPETTEDLKDFISAVVPEHINKKKGNLDISLPRTCSTIDVGLTQVNASVKEGFLPDGLSFDKKHNRVHFKFIKKERHVTYSGKGFREAQLSGARSYNRALEAVNQKKRIKDSKR